MSAIEPHHDCDVLIVGSGAGGATTAAVLAEAGYDVLIVEEGPWVDQGTVVNSNDPAAAGGKFANGAISRIFTVLVESLYDLIVPQSDHPDNGRVYVDESQLDVGKRAADRC